MGKSAINHSSMFLCIHSLFKNSLTSFQFDDILKKPVRVRFGSTSFLKNRFGFGSVRLHFWKIGSGSVRFDSTFEKTVRFDFIFEKPVRVRFRSTRTEPNRYSSVRFGSFSVSGADLPVLKFRQHEYSKGSHICALWLYYAGCALFNW